LNHACQGGLLRKTQQGIQFYWYIRGVCLIPLEAIEAYHQRFFEAVGATVIFHIQRLGLYLNQRPLTARATGTGLMMDALAIEDAHMKPGKGYMAVRTQQNPVFTIDAQVFKLAGQLFDLAVDHAVHRERLFCKELLQGVLMQQKALAFHKSFFVATMLTMYIYSGTHIRCLVAMGSAHHPVSTPNLEKRDGMTMKN